VEQVLAWLKPHLPFQQHTALLAEVFAKPSATALIVP
jgi:hypothetical protein